MRHLCRAHVAPTKGAEQVKCSPAGPVVTVAKFGAELGCLSLAVPTFLMVDLQHMGFGFKIVHAIGIRDLLVGLILVPAKGAKLDCMCGCMPDVQHIGLRLQSCTPLAFVICWSASCLCQQKVPSLVCACAHVSVCAVAVAVTGPAAPQRLATRPLRRPPASLGNLSLQPPTIPPGSEEGLKSQKTTFCPPSRFSFSQGV